jgi:hypothetical protein
VTGKFDIIGAGEYVGVGSAGAATPGTRASRFSLGSGLLHPAFNPTKRMHSKDVGKWPAIRIVGRAYIANVRLWPENIVIASQITTVILMK